MAKYGVRTWQFKRRHLCPLLKSLPPFPRAQGLKPKKPLVSKDKAYFDSADWAMQKEQQPQVPKPGQGKSAMGNPPRPSIEQLPVGASA